MAITSLLFTLSALISLTSLKGVLGGIICEKLPVEVCAFSVSSSGVRCVLEKSLLGNGNVQYECQSSDVTTDKNNGWVETEECVNACGVDRLAVGLSSDAIAERSFMRKLCSPDCYDSCHNIVELYFDLAAGEGIFLPRLCEAHKDGNRRIVSEVISQSKSSITADSFPGAPLHSFAGAPVQSFAASPVESFADAPVQSFADAPAASPFGSRELDISPSSSSLSPAPSPYY